MDILGSYYSQHQQTEIRKTIQIKKTWGFLIFKFSWKTYLFGKTDSSW
jgi:hypothetical protein